MKRKTSQFLVLILCLLVALSLTACTSGDQGAKANPANSQSEQENGGTGKNRGDQPANSGQPGQNVNPDEFKQWDGVKGRILVENYPTDIAKYLTDHKDKETQQAFNINNRTYLVLTMGQMPSAGYQIELKDIVLKDGVLKVFVKYEKPGQNDLVATVITYPTLVIETDDIYEGHYDIQYDIEK